MDRVRRVLILVLGLALIGRIGDKAVNGQVKLRAGVLPVIALYPLYAAVEKGFFKQEGIEVEMVPMRSGAGILEAVAGRSAEAGFTNTASLIIARERGFDFVIVWGTEYLEKTSLAVMVKKDAAINNFKDLERKTVAIISIKSFFWLFLRERVVKDGGNPELLRWVEIPIPQMAPPLLRGEVDAIAASEPFLTPMKADPKLKLLGYYVTEVKPSPYVATFVASQRWAEREPQLAEKFGRGLTKALDYIKDKKEEGYALASKNTGVKLEEVKQMDLARWKSEADLEELRWLMALMQKHALINRPINLEEMIFKTAR